jgi:hypothetical protein
MRPRAYVHGPTLRGPDADTVTACAPFPGYPCRSTATWVRY